MQGHSLRDNVAIWVTGDGINRSSTIHVQRTQNRPSSQCGTVSVITSSVLTAVRTDSAGAFPTILPVLVAMGSNLFLDSFTWDRRSEELADFPPASGTLQQVLEAQCQSGGRWSTPSSQRGYEINSKTIQASVK